MSLSWHLCDMEGLSLLPWPQLTSLLFTVSEKMRAKAFFLPFSFGSLHLLSPMPRTSSSPHPPQLAAHLVLP